MRTEVLTISREGITTELLFVNTACPARVWPKRKSVAYFRLRSERGDQQFRRDTRISINVTSNSITSAMVLPRPRPNFIIILHTHL